MRNHPDNRQESAWTRSAPAPVTAILDGDVEADVCIVGAGIAGMTTAYLLGREGRRVVVLDDGPVGGGETGRTTAHLSNALDDRYYELERLHGEEHTRLAAQSHTAAIDKIESIVQQEGIDCDFLRLDGYLFAGAPQDVCDLDRELGAARRAGLMEVEKVDGAPAPFDTGPALRFPRQGQFHPLRYLAGLSCCTERDGGRIYSGAHVTAVDRSHRGDGPIEITTSTGSKAFADIAIVATNTPINNRFELHTKQAAYRTYVIACRVPTGSIPGILLWDTRQSAATPYSDWSSAPYHYIRLQQMDGHDLLIVGGEDHKTGQGEHPEHRWAALEAWAHARYPMIERIEHRWSGQIMEPVDAMAFIGHNPLDDHDIYICTGDSGNGMTHGMIAGMLITDLIANRHNPWAALYDPSRKTLASPSIKKYAKENLDVAAHYVEYATPGEVSSVDQIAPDDGAVVRQGIRKVAVYRDASGELHDMSAICPHLGCVVHWNSAEKTWDCPCHGSRFDCHGDVINGPATEPLHARSGVRAPERQGR